MANISTENINTLAQLAASISDGDYIYIFKSGSGSFARIEKSVFLSGVAGGATSSKVKANVNALQAKIDELIGVLAPLAYNGNIPSQIGALDWDEDVEPGTPVLTSPNGTTVNVGGHNGSGVSKSILVKGSNLTQALSVSISGTGFSVSTNSVSAANANSGTYISVTYNGTQSSASGTLTISSSEVSVNVPLTASYSESVTTHDVTINSSGLSHCSYSHNMGSLTVVVDGGGVEITILPNSNYTLLGVTASVSATNGSVTQSYDSTNDRIIVTVSNITADTTITIGATAVAQGGGQEDGYVTDGLVFHLDSEDFTNGMSTWTAKVGGQVFTMTDVSKTDAGVVFNGTSSKGVTVDGAGNNLPLSVGSSGDQVGTIEVVVKSMSCHNKACVIRVEKSYGIALLQWMTTGNYFWDMLSGKNTNDHTDHNVVNINNNDNPSEMSSFTGYFGVNQSNAKVNDRVYPSPYAFGIQQNYMPFKYQNGRITLGFMETGNGITYAKMTLCAVRIYNRELSAQDLATNYTIDKTKYSLE